MRHAAPRHVSKEDKEGKKGERERERKETHGFKLVQLRVGFVRGFVRASLS
jgi:hypothetical protein